MIRGVIFDMDGTLLDSMPMWQHAGENFLRRHGCRPAPHLAETLYAMTMAEGAEYLCRCGGLTLSAAEVLADIRAAAMRYYREAACLKPGALEFVRRLYAAGVPMTVATTTDSVCAVAALEHTGVLPYLARVCSASDIGTGKDTPALYLCAAEALRTPPAETLVMEDALYAVRTANRAGFLTAALYDAASEKDQPALQAESRFYFRRWAEAERLLPLFSTKK